MIKKNLYKILGVSKDIKQEELKKVYHNLARIHHPDKGGSSIVFQELNEAYNILSTKRDLYDEYGMDGVNGIIVDSNFGYGVYSVVNDDENITYELNLNIEQLFNKNSFKIKYYRKYICVCKNNDCQRCGKTGAYMKEEEITYDKDIGYVDKIVIFKGKGHKIQKNGVECRTDLVVHVNYKPDDNIFKLFNENDLVVDVNINIYEALVGFQRYLRHPSGELINFKNDKMMKDGEYVIVDNYGMLNGNLLVQCHYIYPTEETIHKNRILINKIFN